MLHRTIVTLLNLNSGFARTPTPTKKIPTPWITP